MYTSVKAVRAMEVEKRLCRPRFQKAWSLTSNKGDITHDIVVERQEVRGPKSIIR